MNQIISSKIFSFTFFLLPISLIIGPLISEIILFFLIVLLLLTQMNQVSEKKLLFIFSLLFFSTLISSSISEYSYSDESNLKNILKSLFHFRFLLLFLITIIILKNEVFKKYFTNLILLCLIFLIFDTLIQNYNDKSLFGFEKSEIGRLSGPFKDEYIVGGVILKFYLIYYSLTFEKLLTFDKKQVFFLILFNFSLLAVILSGERSSMILFLLIILFNLIYLLLNNVKSLIVFVLSILIFSPLHYSNSKFMTKRFVSIKNDVIQIQTDHKKNETKFIDNTLKDLSSKNFLNNKIISYGYTAHFYSALSISKNNILFGVGQRNFRKACLDIKTEGLEIKLTKNLDEIEKNNFLKNLCTTHPHQIYLEILSETGIIGLFFFIIILFNILKRIIVSKKTYLIGPIMVLFFPLLPTGSYFNNFNSMFFWIIIGVIISLSIKNKNFFSA